MSTDSLVGVSPLIKIIFDYYANHDYSYNHILRYDVQHLYILITNLHRVLSYHVVTHDITGNQFLLLINDALCGRINDRLRLWFPRLDIRQLMQAIEVDNACISGGFLFHILFPDHIPDDLDIFVPESSGGIIASYLRTVCDRFGPHCAWRKPSKMSDYDNTLITDVTDYTFFISPDRYGCNFITRVIQVITVKTQCIKSYINEEFDLDILKNCFYFNKGQPRFAINSINDLINRRITINQVPKSWKTIEVVMRRLDKYTRPSTAFRIRFNDREFFKQYFQSNNWTDNWIDSWIDSL